MFIIYVCCLDVKSAASGLSFFYKLSVDLKSVLLGYVHKLFEQKWLEGENSQLQFVKFD